MSTISRFPPNACQSALSSGLCRWGPSFLPKNTPPGLLPPQHKILSMIYRYRHMKDMSGYLLGTRKKYIKNTEPAQMRDLVLQPGVPSQESPLSAPPSRDSIPTKLGIHTCPYRSQSHAKFQGTRWKSGSCRSELPPIFWSFQLAEKEISLLCIPQSDSLHETCWEGTYGTVTYACQV